jgi:hypothetical protein
MKTVDTIINLLRVTESKTIIEIADCSNCQKYDVLNSLLKHGLIVIDAGFKLSNNGNKWITDGNDIQTYKFHKDACNLILYSLLFSNITIPESIGKCFDELYNGADIISNVALEFRNNSLYSCNIKFKKYGKNNENTN